LISALDEGKRFKTIIEHVFELLRPNVLRISRSPCCEDIYISETLVEINNGSLVKHQMD